MKMGGMEDLWESCGAGREEERGKVSVWPKHTIYMNKTIEWIN